MVNNQGLTPTERALNRAAPGFAMMLQGVQQYANRVEENRRLAEQRSFQRERETNQFQNQMELTAFSHELQSQSQREIQEMRAAAGQQQAILDSEIRTREKITDLQIESSGLGIEARQMQAYAQSSGTEMGKAPRVALDRLDSAQTFLSDMRQKFPNLPMIEVDNGPNGEVRFFEITPDGNPVQVSRGYLDLVIGNQAQNKVVADTIDRVMETGDFTSEVQQELLRVRNAVLSGDIRRSEAERYITSLTDRDQRLESATEQRERVQSQNRNIRAITVGIGDPVRGTLTREGALLFAGRSNPLRNQTFPSIEGFRTDETLMSIVNSGDFENVRGQLTEYINSNVVSLNGMITAAEDKRFNRTDNQDKPSNIQQYQVWQDIKQTIEGAGSGRVGEQLFLNTFAQTNDPNAVVNADAYATILYRELRRLGAGTPPITTITADSIRGITGY
jgi:hypothetical protein